jgi:hypothetical protein
VKASPPDPTQRLGDCVLAIETDMGTETVGENTITILGELRDTD